jgi:siroheme synthase
MLCWPTSSWHRVFSHWHAGECSSLTNTNVGRHVVCHCVLLRCALDSHTTCTQDPGQQRLNIAALDALRRGERVVRLKSGDPFVYGRGGEELTFFRANGFEARVLPGVSSALAAPALAEISVTHRGVADQVLRACVRACTSRVSHCWRLTQLLILAAHGRGGALPDIPTYNARRTLVFLMVAKRVERVAADCIAREYPHTLPAAVIERAATAHQRVIRGTLADIGELATRAVLIPPATVRSAFVVDRASLVVISQELDSCAYQYTSLDLLHRLLVYCQSHVALTVDCWACCRTHNGSCILLDAW